MPAVPMPPLGLMPRHIWQERQARLRIDELLAAMRRYAISVRPAPAEWVDELEELLEAFARPPLGYECKHTFEPVKDNPYCGQCGAGKLHSIHFPPEAA